MMHRNTVLWYWEAGNPEVSNQLVRVKEKRKTKTEMGGLRTRERREREGGMGEWRQMEEMAVKRDQ